MCAGVQCRRVDACRLQFNVGDPSDDPADYPSDDPADYPDQTAMEFKDYYAVLGLERTADPARIKRAYRKLARKYHPDVSDVPDAETRFKEVSEAYEALSDPERRAAYDAAVQRRERGESFEPPPDGHGGFGFGAGRPDGGAPEDFSDFFEALFGRQAQRAHEPRGTVRAAGSDHHARILIDLTESYHGAQRTLSMRVPGVDDQGRRTLQERQLEVRIPKGVREGQHLRLTGQGSPGYGGGPAGDLYLEIRFRPDPRFRVDGRDVFVDVPIAPWEAALGAPIVAPTPDGSVQLTVPAGSSAGRKLRLKGKGLPGEPAGDLYVVLTVSLPPADTPQAKEAFAALARAFPHFDARRAQEA